MFPGANCNLRQYWKNNPAPPFTNTIVHWSLKQMMGIAGALEAIDYFYLEARSTDDPVVFPIFDNHEGFIVRSHYVEPENIQWFERIPLNQRQREHGHNTVIDDNDEGGILQITVFGLGQLQGRGSGTEYQPKRVFSSSKYEPPECKIHRQVSHRYYIWSLGCLYLEFATWILKGYDALKEFSDHRAGESGRLYWSSDDVFFKVIEHESSVIEAVVSDSVKHWAQKLHEDEKCSEFIHELVDLVMEELLRIDAEDRIQTLLLCARFDSFLEKAETDFAYLCKPDQRPRK